MTKEELAKVLNGREYRKEITKDEEQLAEESGLVVVFGASDDLTEFRGAINDETGGNNGKLIPITKKGLFESKCTNDRCPYCAKILEGIPKIKVFWNKDGYCWKYEAPYPVAGFDIVEGDQKYCRGIVFDINNLCINPGWGAPLGKLAQPLD